MLLIAIIAVSLAIGRPWISIGIADPPTKQGPKPILIRELEPKLDGKEVTVKFTIKELHGITQINLKEGQAGSFGFLTESDKHENRLDVWVEGELANVMDRLQMSIFQDNELKVGTTIVATGLLSVHKLERQSYHLSVTEGKNFRVLPSGKKK